MNPFQKRFWQAKEVREMKWIDIANKSGLDKAQISQYKNGKHIPEQDALYKLAMALNVNIEWLMGYDVPMDINRDTIWDDSQLINQYHLLNDMGKKEIMKRLDEVIHEKQYRK